MQLIGFLGLALVVVVIVHGYLWWRLVRDTTWPGRLRRIGTLLAVLLALLVPATLIASRAFGPDAARWLAWPGYLWLALMFYLLVVLLLLELPRLLVWLAVRGRSRSVAAVSREDVTSSRIERDDVTSSRLTGAREAPLLTRRLLLARSGAAVAGVAAAGSVGYGMASALGAPRLEQVTVSLGRLPAGLDGLRIAVVSDLHLGPLLGRSHTERVVTMINEQRPDLVAIVGDVVDGTVAELGEAVAPLRDLVSRHGSFFVTGNHEYYSGAAPWVREFARIGVNPLLNQRTEIRSGDAVLDLAGVNDVTGDSEGQGPDYRRALGGRDQTRPVVLLAHQPVQVHQAAANGVDLQLSGHTHGGQMFPFHGIVVLAQPVVSGLHRFGDTQLYLTRGTGFWGPPVRVGAPPEITMVHLRRS